MESFGPRSHSKSDCRDVFHVEESGTLKQNMWRTKRDIYKHSTAFVLFLSDLASQANLIFGLYLTQFSSDFKIILISEPNLVYALFKI